MFGSTYVLIRKTIAFLTMKTSNRVIFNGGKNTTNGVHQHHFNYLIIYLFRQIWYFLRSFLSFLGPNLPMDTRFLFICCISSQIIVHSPKWQWYELRRVYLQKLWAPHCSFIESWFTRFICLIVTTTIDSEHRISTKLAWKS